MTDPSGAARALTPEVLDDIERGCEGVTPGPWRVFDGSSWRRIGHAGVHQDDCAVLAPTVASDGHPDLTTSRGNDRNANLAHIARLDPQTVLALVAAARIGMSGWRDDMENAPRDGTEVMLYYREWCGVPDMVVSGHWECIEGREYEATWEHSNGSGDADCWMPLPPSPGATL